MNNVDYMQNNNGRVTMYCEQLPDKGFIDAIKVRNICMIRIYSTKYKKANKLESNQDVELIQASGEKRMITRKELIQNFVHCNGRRIIIRRLRSNYKYFVYNMYNQGEMYKVLRIPNNCVGILGSKDVKPGHYIVAKADQEGNIDRTTLSVVTDKMFRKSFKIPMQAIIKKHMQDNPNQEFGLYNPNRLAEVRRYNRQNSINNIERSYPQNTQPKHEINMGTGLGNIVSEEVDLSKVDKPVTMPNINNMQNVRRPVVQRPPLQNRQQTANAENNTKSVYKYTITHRIISSINKGMVGFVVKEISSGKSKQLTTQQVMQLCEKRLVDNVMLVTKENGMRYLKGNNVRIESLPQVIG